MLMAGMGAVTYRAQSIQGGDAPGGGEVAVAAAADDDVADGFSHFRRSLDCLFIQTTVGFGEFKGRPVHAAGNFQRHPILPGLQRVHQLGDPLALFLAGHTDIHLHFRFRSDHIEFRSAGKHTHIDGGSLFQIGHCKQLLDQIRRFQNGAAALDIVRTRMGGLAVNLDQEVTGGLSAHLYRTVQHSAFQDQRVGILLRNRFKMGPGGAASHLLIGIKEETDPTVQTAGGLQRLDDPNGGYDTVLHIVHTGAGQPVAVPNQRQVVFVPDRVEVAHEQGFALALADLIVHMASPELLGIHRRGLQPQPALHQIHNGIGAFVHQVLADRGTLMLGQENRVLHHLLLVLQKILSNDLKAFHNITS